MLLERCRKGKPYSIVVVAEGTMVAIRNHEMVSIPLKEVGRKTRLVPHDHFLIKQAKRVGTFFGEYKLGQKYSLLSSIITRGSTFSETSAPAKQKV